MAATFLQAIQYLRPGVDFSNRDNTLAGIRWDTPGVSAPTQQEVDAAIVALTPPDPAATAAFRALQQRRADQLGASADPADQLAALKIRLELLGG
jgi:hypothetical protein